ncbi:MAG TPA: hypothetical protein ENJ60_01645 [Aeromonadales bacterium]|nr:hypothetical protein [Aeromonadales bacterium]
MPTALNFKSLVLTGSLLLCLYSPVNVAKEQGEPVRSPQWGEVLFSHYKGDDLDALIRLLAREQQGKLKEHETTANLFAAGLLLDLGLPVAAQERLDNTPADMLSAWQKSRLSMALARVYYRQQHYNKAQLQLAQIDEKHLDEDDIQRKRLMSAQLLFRNHEYEAASRQLESIEKKGNMQLYARYNNGLSLLQLNDPLAQVKGEQLLESIVQLQPLDQEQYALKDQAILALALYSLRIKDAKRAQNLLLTLRVDGLVTHDGLLTLGWSYAAEGDYKKALIYWLKLSEEDDLLEPTVQESWLAVPYAYQQQGDFQSAIYGYEQALSSHLKALESLNSLEDQEAWRALLYQQQTANNSFTKNSPGFQRQLVGDAEFFELLSQWQQLYKWDNKLQFALTALTPIRVMLETNDQRFKEKSALVNEKLKQISDLKLAEKQSELKQILKQQKQLAVAELLLPEQSAKIWHRLQSAEQLTKVIPEEKLGEKGEQLRRIKGVALWDFHRNRAETIQNGSEAVEHLGREMTKLNQQISTLEVLLSKPRQPLPEALARVAELKKRGQETVSMLTELTETYERAMANRFNHLIDIRRRALTQLAEQATLALARLRFKALRDEKGMLKDGVDENEDSTSSEVKASRDEISEPENSEEIEIKKVEKEAESHE